MKTKFLSVIAATGLAMTSFAALAVTANAATTVDLSTLTAGYEAQDGDILTGTLGGNYKITIADGATVTLRGAEINGIKSSSYKWAGITPLGDATIILEGTNSVTGFYDDYPGIFAAENKTLTIQGSGSLTAASNGWAAGIGAGRFISCGSIAIKGGNITATGGNYSAGIGGGQNSACGSITISGGTVDATGGDYRASGIGIGGGSGSPSCGSITISGGSVTAKGMTGAGIGTNSSITISGGTVNASSSGSSAGIGGGYESSCGDITITGGTVTATGDFRSAGIGGGCYSSCGNITITDDATSVTAIKGSDAPYSIGEGFYSVAGTITIEGVEVGAIGESPYTYLPPPLINEKGEVDLSALKSDYEAQDGDILTGTLNGQKRPNKITIADGATVTLKDVTVNGTDDGSYKWAGITPLGDATIILEGTNSVKGFYQDYPGIFAAAGKTLTIQGSGSLTASSNGQAAGIGGGFGINCGNIVIKGGNITASGGNYSAGIGSGAQVGCGKIEMTGGTVIATGGQYGAGIGTAFQGNCGSITINGGTVNATGGSSSAGIGGGYASSCGSITVTDHVREVTATRGASTSYCIGKGYSGEVGTITILDEEKVNIYAQTYTIYGVPVSGDLTRVVAVKNGNDTGATALITTLTKNVDEAVTVSSVTWNVRSGSETGSCTLTAEDDLPTLTFDGEGSTAMIVLAINNLYDPSATARVTVN